MTGTPVRIDVVSDVICPWCYVGKRRLEAALRLVGDRIEPEVVWQPYLLNPDMPPEGMARRDYRMRKFGSQEHSDKLDADLAAVGAPLGIDFAFAEITRTPSTLDAHRLIAFAIAGGVQDAVVESLFRRYFVQGEDVSARDVLLACAAECGLDGERVRALLADDLLAAEVSGRARELSAGGVSAVPFFVIAQRESVAGAQEPAALAAAIERAV